MTCQHLQDEATTPAAGVRRTGFRPGFLRTPAARGWRATLAAVLVASLVSGTAGGASGGESRRPATLPTPQECGPLTNSFGPFDYRDPRNADPLKNINSNHFGPDVEAGIRGQSGSIGNDLNYTLRAFPNHHRALLTLVRLAERNRSEDMLGLGRPVTCWLVRAAEYAPDDPVVHSIFAVHLKRRGLLNDAVRQVEQALALRPDDPNTLYNAGLLHFDAKNYDKAAEYAVKAYKAGFELPGLKQKLQAMGKWRE